MILRSWTFQPAVLASLTLAVLWYLAAMRRFRSRTGRSIGVARWGCYMGGVAAVAVALVSPIARYSELLLSVHMVQHLLLIMVAPPLLLLGAPVTLLLQASSGEARRRWILPALHGRIMRVVAHPLVGWSLLAILLWASHFSPLYERALENETVHALEHGAYLVAALLFWRPVVGLDPAGPRLSEPGRLLYLFLAMPQSALLGVAIYGSGHVLYPHYLAATSALGLSALADQHLAGAIMWEGGLLVMVPAMSFVLYDWLGREERAAARADRHALPISPPGA